MNCRGLGLYCSYVSSSNFKSVSLSFIYSVVFQLNKKWPISHSSSNLSKNSRNSKNQVPYSRNSYSFLSAIPFSLQGSFKEFEWLISLLYNAPMSLLRTPNFRTISVKFWRSSALNPNQMKFEVSNSVIQLLSSITSKKWLLEVRSASFESSISLKFFL